MTAVPGPWRDGFAACSAEAGSSFSVPATGYENEQLKGVRGQGEDVWLDYALMGSPARWTPNAPSP